MKYTKTEANKTSTKISMYNDKNYRPVLQTAQRKIQKQNLENFNCSDL